MTSWFERHKPAAPMSVHLLAVGLMWATVGSVLAGFGVRWSWTAHPGAAPWITAACVLLGVLKSRMVLDRAARRIIERIRLRGDGRCLGAFLSLRTWFLVLIMASTGRLLRATATRGLVGALYLTVGTALCLSSRLPWRAWQESRRSRESPPGVPRRTSTDR